MIDTRRPKLTEFIGSMPKETSLLLRILAVRKVLVATLLPVDIIKRLHATIRQIMNQMESCTCMFVKVAFPKENQISIQVVLYCKSRQKTGKALL